MAASLRCLFTVQQPEGGGAVGRLRRQNVASVDFEQQFTNLKLASLQAVPLLERKEGQLVASRRMAAAAAMTLAMRAANFGSTYTAQVVSSMPHFLDRIIVQAAALKQEPGHAHLSFTTRARSCIEGTHVLPLIRWLKHNSLTAARIGEIVSFAGDHLETVRPRVEWLKQQNVRGRDIGLVLCAEPGVMFCSFNELNSRINILSNAGVKREWMGLLLRSCPSVLTTPLDELCQKVELLASLGVDESNFGTMVYKMPTLLGPDPCSQQLQVKVSFLRDLGLDDARIGQMAISQPHLLISSLEHCYRPAVQYLRALGVGRPGLRRILVLNPAVLCFNLDEYITPKVRFLRDIGVEEQDIPNVLVDFPDILSCSLETKIIPTVGFLRCRAGVKQAMIGSVITSMPEIFGFSLGDKLEQCCSFYLSLGLQRHQLGDMVANFPMLLKYKPAVLLPKFRYLTRVMQRPIEEVAAFPRFFSYSLETRIAPRHEMLMSRGVRLELEEMLACTDGEFAHKLTML